MKIAIFEHEPWMEEHIKNLLPEHDLVFTDQPLTDKNVADFQDVAGISVFVYSKVTSEVIESLPNLKLITARSTGYDHIDLAAAARQNIAVANVPHYGSITVAEHTWSLILSLSRKIFQSYERTERADFDLIGLRGMDLSGKTLGLVGLGEIGQRVALMSKGFNMKLRVFNRSKDQSFLDQFENAVYVDRVEDIFSHSDVISFHVPLSPDTHHLLNVHNYQILKPGCLIINTARGQVIETKALLKGLQENIINGAGLDVLESEVIIKDQQKINPDELPNEQELSEAFMDHMLIGMNNVIITPHNAFNSNESIKKLLDNNINNIKNFFDGKYDELNQVGLAK